MQYWSSGNACGLCQWQLIKEDGRKSMQGLVLGWFAAWGFCLEQVGEWQTVVSTVVGEYIRHTQRPRKWRQRSQPA
jgi:hypothetical protein